MRSIYSQVEPVRLDYNMAACRCSRAYRFLTHFNEALFSYESIDAPALEVITESTRTVELELEAGFRLQVRPRMEARGSSHY